jgi:hypothetical protein
MKNGRCKLGEVHRTGFILLCACRFNFDPIDGGAGSDTFPAMCMSPTMQVPASGVISGTIANMPDERVGTCGGMSSSELIYEIDVPTGAGLVIGMDGVNSSANTLLYVRTDCDDAATEIVCDINGGGGDLAAYRLSSPAPGRKYVIIEGETTGDVDGTIQLLLPLGATCSGDDTRDRCAPELRCDANTRRCIAADCTVAETFTTPGTFSRTVMTTGGTNFHAGECGQSYDGGARSPEIVFRAQLATPVTSMRVSTDSPNTDFDTLIYARSGCTGPELGCSDDLSSNNFSSDFTTGPLPAGDYYIFIDGFSTRDGSAAVTIDITP